MTRGITGRLPDTRTPGLRRSVVNRLPGTERARARRMLDLTDHALLRVARVGSGSFAEREARARGLLG